MISIGPGDCVVCVDASDSPFGPTPLVEGQRYTIAAVWEPVPWKGTETSWMSAAVSLVEVPDPAPHIAWGIYRFKSIDGSELTGERTRVRELETQ